MSARTDVLRWGRERARAGPWRGDGHVAYLAPTADGPVPSLAFLERCLRSLSRQGYTEVVTAALAPAEQTPFRTMGFEEHERLRLLTHDLRRVPGADRSPVRRAHAEDRPAVLALDAVAFSPFWQLDDWGLGEAIRATPVARFRVADVGGVVVGYAVAGRSRHDGYLQRLAVHPAYQRQGLGRALTVDALLWMRHRGSGRAVVNTQIANSSALALYLALGFREQHNGLAVLRRSLR